MDTFHGNIRANNQVYAYVHTQKHIRGVGRGERERRENK